MAVYGASTSRCREGIVRVDIYPEKNILVRIPVLFVTTTV
jgi:hypothetical protein